MPSIRILFPLVFCILLVGFIQARTFTDDKGRAIEAELVAVDGGKVTFKTRGKDFTLPITRFSASDQDYIKKWAAEKAVPLPKPKPDPAGSKPNPSSPDGSKPGDSPTAPAPETPKPGATLRFEFPELEYDFKGKPAAFAARIPKGYDPAKPVPLFIFLGGGSGSGSPGGAVTLTNGDFVCAGLPYPNNGRNPRQTNMVGQFDRIWDYWKPMLAKLEEAVPNLDPNFRVIGGFSNGAHAIDGLLGDEDFASAFSAFILIEGGGSQGGAYRGGRGKHIYYASGEKSPIALWARTVLARAKNGGMKLHFNEMKGIGHQFPSAEKAAVKTWLYETAIPDRPERRPSR